MPELPEMENYKQLLNEKIKNKVITNVEINRSKSINVPIDLFIERVQNQKIKQIDRKAKHLLFHLENGSILLLHLMLGGWMYYGMDNDKPDRTIQVKLSFGEMHLYFIGLRLGYLHVHDNTSIDEELADLGPEPLDLNFSLDQFLKEIEGRRGRLKTTLVDQQFLSGIGNRYSDEISWHAGVLPTRKMNEIENNEAIQLFHSIRNTLQYAITNGGYMEHALYIEDNKTGGQLNHFNVYNREGDPCKRCGSTIVQDEIASRKTFFCANCQK